MENCCDADLLGVSVGVKVDEVVVDGGATVLVGVSVVAADMEEM